MNKKQILNEEFLKSIESEYVFSDKPLKRIKSEDKGENIKLKLENLKKKISLIENCDLKKNAKQIVFGEGNFNNKIMIVGEGPGEEEDKLGNPFAGDSGNLLNKMLSAINLKRKNVYITYVVNFRPPEDRKPSSTEINRYSEFLLEHITIINPKILIIMGSTAMEALVGKNTKISTERGKWKEILIKNKTYLSIITFHPSYLLKQPEQKKYSWYDLKEIKKKINSLNINLDQ
tara:strand:+ start:163 stop:858 length:696 start_codon:yes stop_codon:yes gene_type:complete